MPIFIGGVPLWHGVLGTELKRELDLRKGKFNWAAVAIFSWGETWAKIKPYQI